MGKVTSSPIVSVIIPTYNRAKYLPAALDSVLSQSMPPFEVIVVDDGSTDDTEQVINPYLSKIIYKKIPNSGRPAVPRNIGIGLAKGNLIAFQDSDDLWASDKLKLQTPLFDDPDVVMSHGRAEIMTAGGKKMGRAVAQQVIPSGHIFTELLGGNFVSTLTTMVRKEVLEQLGGFNESPALRAVEDYDLWLRIAALGRKVVYLDKTLAYYRQHDQNISSADEALALRRIITVNSSVLKSRLTKPDRITATRKLSGYWRGYSYLVGGLARLRARLAAEYFRLNAKLLELTA